MAGNPSVVFVLGPPGAGKGTQCERIVEEFKFCHLSAGDLLRQERNSGSDLAELINNYIKEGQIVPVEITVGLIDKAMTANGGDRFLIDGFPRNQDNLDGWRTQMAAKVNEKFCLFLDCAEEISTARCLGRGGGRVDDNIESLKKRHTTYMTQTRPIIDVFGEQGMVRQIDATQSKEQVWTEVSDLFKAEGF
eukprot:m.156226 g.156226  ORF g.156226 m.156226 type:complete len:192 (+) comp14318_c0_seq1:220-795(+)